MNAFRQYGFVRAVIFVSSYFCAISSSAAQTEGKSPAANIPEHRFTGTIRISGNHHMAALMKRWESGFKKIHQQIQFATTLNGSAAGIYGLDMRVADIALMGRPLHPYERYGNYERAWVYPVEMEVATGSEKIPGKSAAYAILVHRDNPVTKLTLAQLDGIFGAERGGGWNALTWETKAARTRDKNIRSWGQLGVAGTLKDQPIRVYAPPLQGAGTITYFQTRVFGGGAMWNEDLREYADREKMLADLAADPAGIAVTALGNGHAGTKAVALAATEGGHFIALTRANVAARHYPLARPVYMVVTIDNEKSDVAAPHLAPHIAPHIRQFLRYVLSREGQHEVTRDGVYLPLSVAVADAQRRKIDAMEIPPELGLILK